VAKEITFRGKLVAKRTDLMGYITYVFENLEPLDSSLKYIMCVRFPNWNEGYIKCEDIGFVTVRYVQAGEDTWFNGTEYMPYRKTDIHFLKFVEEPKPLEDVVLAGPDKEAKEFVRIKLND